MHRVYLSLGSNWGRREEWLRKAERLLNEGGVYVIGRSSIYRTPPTGFRFQPSFLNLVIVAQTVLTPGEVLDTVKSIERRIGRIRLFPNSPRRIDIDLLFYNNTVMSTTTLTLPHPKMHKRAFVLLPLSGIAPGLRHPVSGKTVLNMLANVDTKGLERWR